MPGVTAQYRLDRAVARHKQMREDQQNYYFRGRIILILFLTAVTAAMVCAIVVL